MKNEDGIVFIGGGSRWYLGYGYKHGFGMWIPYRVQSLIVTSWNRVVCRCRGKHESLVIESEGINVPCLNCGWKP